MAETPHDNSLRFSLKSLLVFAMMIALLCAVWAIQYRETRRTITAAPAFKLTTVPAEVTVKQRSTTSVPGSNGELLLTLDDITRGQVMASLATASGEFLLPPRSMSSDDTASFRIGKSSYTLKLNQLNNALVGEDFATFNISESSGTRLTENDKIEQLISAVAELQDSKFIRNGAEYGAAEAADHLRTKWRAAGGEIKTAEEFVETIASNSSTTGEPYRIRMPDGHIIEAEAYLRKRLGEIE